MSWYALRNLEHGRGFSFRAIGDPTEATEEEVVVPAEFLDGLENPVWDADQQRPVSLREWRATGGGPQGSGLEGRLLGPVLEGTSREPPNLIGSFGARLTVEHRVPSGEWTKVPFDEVLWDTGGMFDPRHGAFVAERDVRCHFGAGVLFAIEYAVGIVRVGLAIRKNGAPVEGVKGASSAGTPQERLRRPMGNGSAIFTRKAVSAKVGDVFEVYVHHDVGVEVPLSTKGPDTPDVPELAQPTANYFMGMYRTL